MHHRWWLGELFFSRYVYLAVNASPSSLSKMTIFLLSRFKFYLALSHLSVCSFLWPIHANTCHMLNSLPANDSNEIIRKTFVYLLILIYWTSVPLLKYLFFKPRRRTVFFITRRRSRHALKNPDRVEIYTACAKLVYADLVKFVLYTQICI
jgi:hypothetical protein